MIITIIGALNFGVQNSYLDPSIMNINAYSLGIGGVSAFANDSTAIFDNASYLIKQNNNVAVSYLNLMGEIDYINISMKLGDYGFGILRNQIMDNVTGTDQNGKFYSKGTYGYSNNVIYLSKALNNDSEMPLAITLKVFYSNIYENSALGANINLSSTYKVTDRIMISNVIKNILNYGQDSIFWSTGTVEDLPVSYEFCMKYEWQDITLFGKLVYCKDITTENTKHFGLSYRYSVFEFLVGYSEYVKDGELNFTLNGGIGVRMNGIKLDYSYKPVSQEYYSSLNHFITMSFEI